MFSFVFHYVFLEQRTYWIVFVSLYVVVLLTIINWDLFMKLQQHAKTHCIFLNSKTHLRMGELLEVFASVIDYCWLNTLVDFDFSSKNETTTTRTYLVKFQSTMSKHNRLLVFLGRNITATYIKLLNHPFNIRKHTILNALLLSFWQHLSLAA